MGRWSGWRRRQSPRWWPLAALLAGSGILHLVRPQVYRGLIPHRLGDPDPWILCSGVAELACAAGLAVPRTRRPAGLASAALFVGVFPGNLTMTARAIRSPRASTGYKVATVARLPLQVPLVSAALKIARGG